MKSQKKNDIVAGIVIALLGAVVVYAASQIRGDIEERLPPRTLPYIVGFLTLGGGAGLVLKSLRAGTHDAEVHWPDRSGFARIGVNLLLLALFVILINIAGMPVATFLYVAAAVWYLDRRRVVGALVAGAASSLVVYFLFMKFLELPLPMGFLER
ncbi:MAG: tripartite tricarboxylate transporter TctB family protein [Thermodesulfobacteriota bacterium]